MRGRLSLILILSTTACNIPRDADGTLDRVQGGEVRVGLAHNPPWVDALDSQAGIEPGLVAELARQLHAKVSFVKGSETKLLESLHRRELDIVVGGFTDDSPWKSEVAFTNPYHEDAEGKKHVLALPPGENAWLGRVEQYLHEKDSAQARGQQ